MGNLFISAWAWLVNFIHIWILCICSANPSIDFPRLPGWILHTSCTGMYNMRNYGTLVLRWEYAKRTLQGRPMQTSARTHGRDSSMFAFIGTPVQNCDTDIGTRRSPSFISQTSLRAFLNDSVVLALYCICITLHQLGRNHQYSKHPHPLTTHNHAATSDPSIQGKCPGDIKRG